MKGKRKLCTCKKTTLSSDIIFHDACCFLTQHYPSEGKILKPGVLFEIAVVTYLKKDLINRIIS